MISSGFAIARSDDFLVVLFRGILATEIQNTMGQLIVLALRVIVPLGIFRYPLAIGIAAMLLGGADVILVDAINFLGIGSFSGLEAFYEGLPLP